MVQILMLFLCRSKKKCLSRYPLKKKVWRKDLSRVEEQEGARVLGVGRNRKQVNYCLAWPAGPQPASSNLGQPQ